MKSEILNQPQEVSCRYLHPIPEINLSGLSRTIAGEIRVHASGKIAASMNSQNAYLESFASHHGLERKLNSLSGGELAMFNLVLLNMAKPDYLYIDGLFSQIDFIKRREIARKIRDVVCTKKQIWISGWEMGNAGLKFDETVPQEITGTSLNLDTNLDRLLHICSDIKIESPTILLDEVSFRYGKRSPKIFERVNLSLDPGRIIHLHGLNGTGKSTLAKLLTGVITPNTGSISFGNLQVDLKKDPHRRFFHVRQNPFEQIVSKSNRSYLELVTEASPTDWPFKIHDVAHGLGFQEFLDFEPFETPLPVLKRITLAGALLSGASWLFIDEPTIGFEKRLITSTNKIMGALVNAGFGLIVVSHSNKVSSDIPVYNLNITHNKIVGQNNEIGEQTNFLG
ncbi:MAG: ATP-binding cassette domain-containing protein [Pseudomonadota bacterium]